ncbi:MAG: hypothetical protein KKB34_01300 [Bacteroidetes bacterium]|nr:hypothetical protein [Bacteroidota bacterium]
MNIKINFSANYNLSKFLLFLTFLISTFSCSSSSYISKTDVNLILAKNSFEWTLEECQTIINFNTVSNYGQYFSKSLAIESMSASVFVTAIPLTENVIKAHARKEAIQKRLSELDHISVLKNYYEMYTSYKFSYKQDEKLLEITRSDTIKGLSFNVVFENQTSPYRPIEIKDGYEYFFLENPSGQFARVTEISGRYAETDFYLTDFLNVIITFSPKTDDGALLFNPAIATENYKLILNGIDEKPIILNWQK